MKRLMTLGLILFFSGHIFGQENIIFNPPRPNRELKHLLVIGSNFSGSSKLFVYVNDYKVEHKRELVTAKGVGSFPFDNYWLVIDGDFQIFLFSEDLVRLAVKLTLDAKVRDGRKEEIRLFTPRPPRENLGKDLLPHRFLFLRANAPKPDGQKWRFGETRLILCEIQAEDNEPPEGDIIVPQEAKVEFLSRP